MLPLVTHASDPCFPKIHIDLLGTVHPSPNPIALEVNNPIALAVYLLGTDG